MRNVIISVAVSLVVIAGVLVAYESWAGDKTGYIDLRRLVQQSDSGAQARTELEELRAQKQEEIQQSLLDLTKLRTKILTEEKNLSPEQLQEQQEVLEQKAKAHNRLVEDIKEELTRRENDVTAEILKKADQALKIIAKKNGYNIILKDPGVIGYLAPEADVTDLVLKEINK
jgi:outer membrane protein